MSILIDAGPSLNFLAVGQANVLIRLAQSRDLHLAAPAKVDSEVLGMSKDPRFARTAVLGTWEKLKAAQRITILDDTLTSVTFTDAVTRISGMPAQQRVRSSRDLGEILVIAHASVHVQSGEHVYVLIDDKDGRRLALKEQQWLSRANVTGSLSLWSTPRVLKHAGARTGWIRNDLTWEQVYKQMMAFDDGLPRL